MAPPPCFGSSRLLVHGVCRSIPAPMEIAAYFENPHNWKTPGRRFFLPFRKSFVPKPNPDWCPRISEIVPLRRVSLPQRESHRVRFSSKSGFPRQFCGHSPSRSGLAPPVPDNRPNGPQSARREQIVPIPAIAGASMSIKFLCRSQYRAGPTSDRDEVQDGYG